VGRRKKNKMGRGLNLGTPRKSNKGERGRGEQEEICDKLLVGFTEKRTGVYQEGRIVRNGWVVKVRGGKPVRIPHRNLERSTCVGGGGKVASKRKI